MNLVELPELMREHAEQDVVPVLAESRIHGIQRKVAAGRRRRLAAGVTGLAVLALAGFGLSGLLPGRTQAPEPAATNAAKKINGYPEYASGGHLVATATSNSLASPVTLTVPDAALGFNVSNWCPSIPDNVEIDMYVFANGHDDGYESCSSGYGMYGQRSLADLHIAPGDPVVFTITPKAYRMDVDGNGNATPTRVSAPLPAGRYSVAIYQRLAFTSYPLPPRPKQLTKLDVREFSLAGDKAVQLATSGTNPLHPLSLELVMPACRSSDQCVDVSVTSQTPGEFDIAVNGLLMNTAQIWSYDGDGYMFTLLPTTTPQNSFGTLRLAAGETVTVTVTPRYVTGAWEFGVGHS